MSVPGVGVSVDALYTAPGAALRPERQALGLGEVSGGVALSRVCATIEWCMPVPE